MKKSLKDSLTGIFLLIAILILVQAAYADKIISMNLEVYKNNSIILNYAKLGEGNPTMYIQPGDYKIEITDSEGKALYNTTMRGLFTILSDPPVESDYFIVNLRIKYVQGMSHLNIFNKQKQIYSKDLNFCNNNGVCEIGSESHLTCPDDCPLNGTDGVCEPKSDGVCDPDCAQGIDIDCPVISTTTTTSVVGTTTTKKATTTVKETTTTFAETTTTVPEKKSDGGILSLVPVIVVLIIVIVLAFFGYKYYQKMQDKKIEKQREEFLKWKELQEKESDSKPKI